MTLLTGAFGVVYKGVWRSTAVAGILEVYIVCRVIFIMFGLLVKSCGRGMLSSFAITEFMKEAEVMVYAYLHFCK